MNSVANGLGSAAVGSETFGVAGTIQAVANVINQASPKVNNPAIDFGAMRVGAAAPTANISVTNQATAAPQAALNASISSDGAPVTASGSFALLNPGGATAPFSASGTLAGVAAQASDATSFKVGLDTSVAGVFNGTATATFASHDADLADLDLGTAAVTLNAQENNFAEVGLTKSGAGAFFACPHSYTLDFGNIALGSGDLTSSLAVLNAAFGPADLLSGEFDLTGLGPNFTLTGFGSFADLVAGQSFGGLSVVVASDVQGAFLSTLVLHVRGSNASGYIGQPSDTTLVLRGSVGAVGAVVAVPEPGTCVLMFAGLLVVLGAARTRRSGTVSKSL